MSETPQLILRLMTFFYAIGYLALAVFCLHRLLQILGRSRGDAVDFSHARPDGGASGGSFHRSQDGFAPIRPSKSVASGLDTGRRLQCSLSLYSACG